MATEPKEKIVNRHWLIVNGGRQFASPLVGFFWFVPGYVEVDGVSHGLKYVWVDVTEFEAAGPRPSRWPLMRGLTRYGAGFARCRP